MLYGCYSYHSVVLLDMLVCYVLYSEDKKYKLLLQIDYLDWYIKPSECVRGFEHLKSYLLPNPV